ncbi:hypothetical protein DFH11DRAFT_1610258, partial [Phellopilus nigrolimitatus]
MSSVGRPVLVVFDIDDIEDPKHWSDGKKRFVAFQVCFLAFTAVFGSSLYVCPLFRMLLYLLDLLTQNRLQQCCS